MYKEKVFTQVAGDDLLLLYSWTKFVFVPNVRFFPTKYSRDKEIPYHRPLTSQEAASLNN